MNQLLHQSSTTKRPITLLIVEDEESYREPLAYRFRREGFHVLTAETGEQGLDTFHNYPIDIAILDVMIPGIDGFSLCRAIRQQSRIPVIVVSAKDAEMDKVQGLELGADDYVTKPYSFRELLARVHAVMRRNAMATGINTPVYAQQGAHNTHAAATQAMHEHSHQSGLAPLSPLSELTSSAAQQEVYEGAGIMLDAAQHIVTVHGEQKAFPLKEFELLHYLMSHAGLVVTRAKLIERVWGADYFGDTKTLDVHIKRIRSKIEANPSSPQHIVTVRGLGYRFNSEEQIAELNHSAHE